MTVPPQAGPSDGAGYGVECPLCRLAPAAGTLRCPGCQEDLTPLVHLRLRGRIAYNEGLRLARAGAYREAVGELERAVRLEPELLVARLVLGKAAAALGEHGRAAAAFEDVLRLAPGHPGAGAALAALAVAG
ncbi:hypothetical protein [Kitasatospora sp. NPDC057223]|uniref:hypothetical protein n=1 Tax=Kitasatospora sp. NPDC057223 TaxID=3346055 RepID=UPI003645920E